MLKTSWSGLPACVQHNGASYHRIGVDPASATVTYLGAVTRLVLTLLQVVRSGPSFSLLGDQKNAGRSVRYDHKNGERYYVGEVVLALVSATGDRVSALWPTERRIGKLFSRIAALGRLWSVDFFGTDRLNTAWDVAIADLYGAVDAVVVQALDGHGRLAFERRIKIGDQLPSDLLMRLETPVVKGLLRVSGLSNAAPYSPLLRSTWSTTPNADRCPGMEFDGTFVSLTAMHAGTVCGVNAPWIVLRDDSGFEVDLHEDFCPVKPVPKLRLNYTVVHTHAGRLQARAVRVA